jgi:hypothetical protein
VAVAKAVAVVVERALKREVARVMVRVVTVLEVVARVVALVVVVMVARVASGNGKGVGRELARTMAMAVAVEVVRAVALAHRHIWHRDHHLGRPRWGGGAEENGRKLRAALRRVVTAAGANGGAPARRWRYCSSVISVVPPDISAKKGKNPAVNGCHGSEEGAGIEDDNDDKYHKGGEEESEAPPSCHCPLLL